MVIYTKCLKSVSLRSRYDNGQKYSFKAIYTDERPSSLFILKITAANSGNIKSKVH